MTAQFLFDRQYPTHTYNFTHISDEIVMTVIRAFDESESYCMAVRNDDDFADIQALRRWLSKFLDEHLLRYKLRVDGNLLMVRKAYSPI